jgi:glycosyltransferase involved in cell wall biosynthesis
MIVVLPNPIDGIAIQRTVAAAGSTLPESGLHILATGRLAHEKGLDILLGAFSRLHTSFPCAGLTIFGKGHLVPELQNCSAQMGLIDAVYFAGYVGTSARYFATASLFVLSSRHERIPNALLEAATAALPIVTTPASPGLVQLLQQAPGVRLPSDSSPRALADALRQPSLRSVPPSAFPIPGCNHFLLPHAIAAFERTLDAVL